MSAARKASDWVKDITTRGNHISYGTFDETTGVVLESPEDLRVAASGRVGWDIPRDIYALSRMIRSEGAGEGLLRAHVAMNDLASVSWADNLFDLLTYSTDPERRGLYGAQYSPAVPGLYDAANARRYATSQNPYEGDLKTAVTAWEERSQGIDRAQGAVKFIDRSSMGKQAGSRSFAEVDASWRGEGLQPFTLADYGSDLVLYRKG